MKDSPIDFLLASFLFTPFFLMISGTNVSLPDSYYSSSGFPFHLGMLFLIIYLPQVKLKLSKVILLVGLVLYTLIWFTEPERQIYLIQSFMFLFYLAFFDAIPEEKLYRLTRYGIIAIKLFVLTHLLSMLTSTAQVTYSAGQVSSGGIGLLSSVVSIFGIPIYQAGLTYPAVLIFALIIDRELFYKKNKVSYWLFLIAVMIIQLAIARRATIGFMMLFLAFYHFRLSVIASIFVLILSFIYNINLELIYRLIDRFNDIVSLNLRQYPIIRSLNMLTDPEIFLIGNGQNNYAHNYPLQLFTTHGVFYSLLILSIFLYEYVYLIFQKNLIFKKWAVIIIAYLFIDFMVNANLTQPYYAGVLSLMIISMKKFNSVYRHI